MVITENKHTAAKPQLLDAFFRTAIEKGLPVAFWQKPNEKRQHAIVDLSGKLKQTSVPLEELAEGFLVAPFVPKERGNYFIKADIHLETISQNLKASFEAGQFGSDEYVQKEAFLQLFNQLLAEGKQAEKSTSFFTNPAVTQSAEEKDYEQLVAKSVEAIKKRVFQKVVLSRQKSVFLPTGFNPTKAFLNLCQLYPNAFVSLISLPEVGTWIGASPETLVHTNAKEQFQTIALAGTQARSNVALLTDATWKQKEIEEQALVSRYIINCFKKIRLREFEEIGPRTVQAGNLMHLRTDFKVNMTDVNFPQLGSVMLDLLHPTSAVCGMPKEVSQQFILQKEGYDRSLYSGYLGPVNIENDSHLFVNLRCMQLQDREAILYAGAGITQDSQPEKEWLETEMKMEVMRKGLLGEEG